MIPAIPDLYSRLRAARGVLVDTSVLLDIATKDRTWVGWSARALAEAADHSILIINPLIYAEVSTGYSTIEALNATLPETLYRREQLPWEAAFLAGKAFRKYRQRGGARSSPMPDFYIGAHAAISGLAVLTRDTARFRTYFPSVDVLAPEGS